eukprot:COSAG04_NODE_215_length_20056_cov_1614.026958_4_plen_256_part_00
MEPRHLLLVRSGRFLAAFRKGFNRALPAALASGPGTRPYSTSQVCLRTLPARSSSGSRTACSKASLLAGPGTPPPNPGQKTPLPCPGCCNAGGGSAQGSYVSWSGTRSTRRSSRSQPTSAASSAAESLRSRAPADQAWARPPPALLVRTGGLAYVRRPRALLALGRRNNQQRDRSRLTRKAAPRVKRGEWRFEGKVGAKKKKKSALSPLLVIVRHFFEGQVPRRVVRLPVVQALHHLVPQGPVHILLRGVPVPHL